MTQSPGRWEPAPAGGLDIPDPRGQLVKEAEEELGIKGENLASIRAVALIEDVDTLVHDAVFTVETHLSAADVEAAHAAASTKEYEKLAIVPVQKLPAFVREHSEQLLPALVPMLEAAGLLAING